MPGSPRLWRLVVAVVLILYLATWAWGVPSVETSISRFVISEYKARVATGDPRVWEVHPRLETKFAVPIAPFVILVWHEYTITGMYGWGGLELFYWTGLQQGSLAHFTFWVA